MAAPAGGGVQDTPKLEYKLHRKFNVFNTGSFDHSWYQKYNLVASSPKHGIVFIASTDGLLAVYRVAELLYSKADPPRETVKLPEDPTHIAVNCDGELLAVAGRVESILIYNVKDFRGQDVSPRLSVSRGSIDWMCDMQWSPSMNETLAIGFCDKITILHAGTGNRKDTSTSNNNGIRCLSWRPSGSSLVVGCADGTLRVYSPDLSLEKTIPAPAPPLFGETLLWAGAVHWMCNNQFAVIYYKNGTNGRETAFTLFNVPEGELPPRVEYVGRLESALKWPRYSLLQMKPWKTMLCAAIRPGTKLLPPDSDGGDSQPPVKLVSELLREDDMYSVGVALDRVPILRLSPESHVGEPKDDGIAHVTLVHVLTQMGDLATYIVSERASTPSVASKEAAECAAPVAEDEGGARARTERRLVETALARLSRQTLAQDPLPAPAEEESPGGAPASFCGPCAALVGPAERKRHARSLPHRASVFAEQELEELVRECVDEQDLELLGPRAGAASQADDCLVELGDGSGWYGCALCELRVPHGARGAHERGRRHGACAALARAAARCATERLHRPGPPCGAHLSDSRLRTLLQLYCGDREDAGTDGEHDGAEGEHDGVDGKHDGAEGERDEVKGDHLHNVD